MRAAFRALMRRPVFTITSIAVLALGFSVNTAIFAMTRAVLLRPIPYQDVDRLVLVGETNPALGISSPGIAPANYLQWRGRVSAFAETSAWRVAYAAVSGVDRPMRVMGVLAEPGFMHLLGVTPMLGRDFTPGEGTRGADRVVLLSYAYWRRQFGGDRGVVGRSLTIDGTPCTVIGVLPDTFKFIRVLNHEVDVWRPFDFDPGDRDHSASLYGKLGRDVPMDRARAELAAAYAALPRETFRDGWTGTIDALSSRLTANQRPILTALEAAVAIVLCIAAANVATLMLALAATRRRETAMRVALGASWWRLVRDLGREAGIVAGTGAALGILIATWAVDLLNRSVSYMDVSRLEPFRLDAPVAAFTGALALACTVLFVLVPSLRGAERDVVDALKDSSTGSTGSVAHGRTRAVLVVAELAMAIVLLTISAQVARRAFALNTMSRGLDTEDVMTAQLSLNAPAYDDSVRMTQFAERVLSDLGSRPGVDAAAIVNYAPLSFVATSFPIEIAGRPEPPGREPLALCWVVTPRYFDAVGMRLLNGRPFTRADERDGEGVAIASRAFAQRFWGRTDVVGEHVRMLFPRSDAFWIPRGSARPLRIVGVVGDVREDGVGPSPREADPQIYLPYAQNPTRIMSILVRTPASPERIVPVIRDAVRSADPDQPTFDERTFEEVKLETFGRSREIAWLIGVFAALSVALSAIGVYGVMAYLTVARRREIAIRVALGAMRGDVMRLIVGDALRLAGYAAGVALVATPLAARFAATRVAGIEGVQPPILAAVIALLTIVSSCAAGVPAYRATRVGEDVALRE